MDATNIVNTSNCHSCFSFNIKVAERQKKYIIDRFRNNNIYFVVSKRSYLTHARSSSLFNRALTNLQLMVESGHFGKEFNI